MFRTPKRTKPTTLDSEKLHVTPPSRILKLRSPDFEKSPVNGSPNALSPSETRRGRPRAEVLNTLILQGSTSPSAIKCTFCSRVFPREKSLQAHLRTHTGEKPYVCDYPRCTRRFAQSGQLKTHQRLHTGEKPFVCSVPNCERRFTHANRHCPEHPDVQLKRFASSATTIVEKFNDEEHSNAVQKWLESVKRKEKRFPLNNINTTPKKVHRNLHNGWISRYDQKENINYLNLQPTKIFKMETTPPNGTPKVSTSESDISLCKDKADMAAHALMKLRQGTFVEESGQDNEDSYSDTDNQSDSQPDIFSGSYTEEEGMDYTPNDSGPESIPESYAESNPESYSEAYPCSSTSRKTPESAEKSSLDTNEIPKKRWMQKWGSAQDLVQGMSDSCPDLLQAPDDGAQTSVQQSPYDFRQGNAEQEFAYNMPEEQAQHYVEEHLQAHPQEHVVQNFPQNYSQDFAQDLAQPINWAEDSPNIVEAENQKRPTVLVRIENGQEKEVSKSDMQVAMALVELGNSKPLHYHY